MTACGAACTCHPDCPMVCTFTSRHEGACDWWLAAGKQQLTSGNSHEHGFDRGKINANRMSGPGGAPTPPDPASPTEED